MRDVNAGLSASDWRTAGTRGTVVSFHPRSGPTLARTVLVIQLSRGRRWDRVLAHSAASRFGSVTA